MGSVLFVFLAGRRFVVFDVGLIIVVRYRRLRFGFIGVGGLFSVIFFGFVWIGFLGTVVGFEFLDF